MTAHLPATTSTRTLTSAPPLSEKLNDLLLSGDSPVVGPKAAAELRAFAAEPEPPLATESEVDTMLGKLALATAQPKLSKDEAKERMAMYWLALRDIPVVDLRGAFVDLLRHSKFMPTPAEVRSSAVQKGAHRRYAKSRARHLAWKHEQEWKPSNDTIPSEELQALLSNTKVGPAA